MTDEKLKELRIELLNETVSFYNFNNRSVDVETKNCFYYLEGKEGCAIGRKISDKELCKELDKRISSGCSGVNNSIVFNSLPEELKILGQRFLSYIQGLHDANSYWDESGLSELGKTQVDYIKKNFNLQ